MKTYTKIIAAVAAGLACTAMTSKATLTTVPNTGADIVVGSAVTTGLGTQLANNLGLGYSIGGAADTGTLQSLVYASDSQAGHLSGYAFEYVVSVAVGDIAHLDLNGFNLSSVAVGIVSGATPVSVDLGANGVLDLTWSPTLGLSGPASVTFIVDTTATQFGNSLSGVSDSAPPGSVGIFAPVPEPTTVAAGALMLLPFGLGALRSLRKDRIA
jgi:hypothetical protein